MLLYEAENVAVGDDGLHFSVLGTVYTNGAFYYFSACFELRKDSFIDDFRSFYRRLIFGDGFYKRAHCGFQN